MTAEATSERIAIRPWGTGIASLVPEWLAIFLFAASVVAWFVVTDPVEVIRASLASPDEPLTRDGAAFLVSSVFGSLAVIAGLVGLGTLMFVRRPGVRSRHVDAPDATPLSLDDEIARLEDSIFLKPAGTEREAARKQIARARLVVLKTQLRTSRLNSPDEIARVIEGGRDAMQEILTELRREGRAEA